MFLPKNGIANYADHFPIASSCCEKLLGIKIDRKLSFEPHLESLCKKVSQKLNALAGTDFKVQGKKIIIKCIYYISVLLCTSSLDVSF